MIDFKKYFPDCEELSSMDDEEDDSDGGPTCLHPDRESSYQLDSKRNPITIKKLELNEKIPKEIKKYKTYHLRSVNLHRILNNTNGIEDTESDDIYQDDRNKYNQGSNIQATRKLLTSSGSSFGGSTDNSPDGDRYSLKKSIQNKELSDFEKDNLLYLDELKERRKNLYKYYEPQVRDLPYYPLGHSKTLSHISGFARKKVSDTVYPRVGSPFPRRKEYPVTAFSPSRATSSKVLRSQSLDEEEEDDILDYWSNSRPCSLFRNFSEPGYESQSLKYPTHEDTCRLNNIHATDNWWSNRPTSVSPVRKTQSPKPMSPHCSPNPNRRAKIPGSLNLKVPTHNTPFSAPSTPITVPPTNSGHRSSFVRESYSRRSHSSPAPGDKLSFAPFNLTMSFNSFQGLQKCRPELEDVGGQFKSILSTSPDDDIRRTFLPITSECISEDTSDEDTSKKNQESSKYQVSPSADSKTSPFNSATSTSENSTFERKSDSPKSNDTSSNQNDAPIATTKPTPMAFTVELGDSAASDSSGSGSTGKKLDISASISQWAPKHRRNLSLTKVDEHKKIEERQNCDKPPLGRPRAGTVGAGSFSARKGGYHSEGYFSSDQDEEGTKRIDLKSPRSPRANESVKSPLSLFRITSSQESPKDSSVRMRPPSPVSSPSSPYAVPLNESASVLIEKMLNATPETKRKFNNKPEGRSCCKERERKPSVSELTGKSYIKTEKDSKMGTDSKNQARNTPTDDIDAIRDDKDDVSEAGTYTIDKDSPSPEIDQAREDIDHVFGVPNESEAEMTSTTAVPMSTTCPEDESSWLSASEMAPPTISRNSPNWIQQWAAQVAEQTKPILEPISPQCKPSLQSPRVGHKLVLSSQESNDSRPRRKLPTPPSHLSKQSNSPRTVDISDSENSKNRARVDKTKGTNPAFRNSSFESHESGGDSDLDTSTSYQFHDDEKLSASIRSKLRLTGLHQSSKNLPSPSPAACSPRRTDGGTIGDPRLLNREATYDLYPTRREECAVQSDSSSETSEPYKDPPPRTVDNNPPLKFNRAFSLRRARLGCEEPALPLSTDKKKLTRPSSAGAVSSGRTKASLGATKSYQSVDNPSVSSPRNYGFGSPRGIASSSLNVVSKVTSSSSDNFDRTDGGRFSLRLPRSVGPSAIGVLKSPSKTNFHKRDLSTSNKKNTLRSNSTLTSKEVDFQNWKRRKNYDPMKAAAEGRKKQGDRKVKNTPEQPTPISDARSPSPLGSLLRSASFHGTEGGMGNMRWNKRGNPPNQAHYTSEDDGPYSLEEEIRHNPSPRHGSPLRRSPTSPHQLCQSPARPSSSSASRARRPSLGPTEEGEAQYQASSRKQISLDETGSEGKRSPMNGVVRGVSVGAGSAGGCGGRPKTKMEALDNLVISTIHSLSVKVRTTSESLLQKLKSQYDEEGDRAALLEEVLSHLSESDQSLTSGQTRSTSRELAGILRNLKKIEHALGVIDRVIIVGDDDYQDDDDLLDEVPQDWVESDY